MSLIASKGFELVHLILVQLLVILWRSVSLLSQCCRDIDGWVNVTLHIGKLLRQIIWITFVDDLILVSIFHCFAEVKHLVDIVWLWNCELRQPLLEVGMVSSRVDKETFH